MPFLFIILLEVPVYFLLYTTVAEQSFYSLYSIHNISYVDEENLWFDSPLNVIAESHVVLLRQRVPAAAVTDPPIRPPYISPKVRSYRRFKDSSDLRRNPFVPRAKNEQDRDGGTQVPKEPVNELRLPKRKRPNLQQEQP
ncbi:hypothetical protein DY000_02005568 [Brassica cretica]|uniref:Uncharacterized protein n=1 Tax=Brassica cretica TaxID=69181 RepID=A0ABQ7BWA5_BRACR|nr:hypothetical protein DY000_02005568 [Brassica cretica]